jgi:UDP-3-O-[3-hydroxymyristoyl] N-acetylglucosamine deacetylase
MTISSGAENVLSIQQHTLARSTQWKTTERRRRRSDVLVVHPAEADSGVRFLRHGKKSVTGIIPAHWDAVVYTRGGILLGNTHGMALHGVIPLLAALRVAGIDNAMVEVHGYGIPAEVSDFDFYLDMLADVGVQTQSAARRLLCVVDTVEVRDSFGVVTLSPATGFRANVNMTTIEAGENDDATLVSDFSEPSAGFSATPDRLREEPLIQTSDARVSLPLREIRTLPEPLRATLVEMLGHLALAGAPVAGNIRARGSSPKLFHALLHAVMERRAVTLTTVDAHRAQHRVSSRAAAAVTDQTTK